MTRKLIDIGVVLLLITTIVLPVSGIHKEPINYEMNLVNKAVETRIVQSVDIAISPTSSHLSSFGRTYELYEGQYLRITLTGYWDDPPDPTKQICLWADNATIPPGATLTPECNCSNGQVTSVFEWIPSPGQAGTYNVVFYLGESCYDPDCSFTITIIVYPTGADDPPIVIINSPADETTVNSPNITVTGYASDDNELTSFGRRHEWTGNQQESSSTFTPPGPTYYSFSENFTLYEGWNRITIYVSDSEWQTAEDHIVIYYEIPANQPPNQPARPSGEQNGKIGSSYEYVSYVSDPDGDDMQIMFDWGDGTYSNWIGPVESETIVGEYHTYAIQGTFPVKIKARDIPHQQESVWSESLVVTMPKNKSIMSPILRFFENHPTITFLLQRVLSQI